jgi:hypothetical protein
MSDNIVFWADCFVHSDSFANITAWEMRELKPRKAIQEVKLLLEAQSLSRKWFSHHMVSHLIGNRERNGMKLR